jgi:hypothetical protein
MYSRTTMEIYIAADQLERGRTTVDTVIHEIAHHTSGAEDLEEAHSEAMTRVAAKVVEMTHDITWFAAWLAGAMFLLFVGKGSRQRWESNMVKALVPESAPVEGLEKAELMPATIPRDDLNRIADKYGWWAAKLAEAVCPHNDVACVEREAKRLVEARRARLE